LTVDRKKEEPKISIFFGQRLMNNGKHSSVYVLFMLAKYGFERGRKL